MADQTINGFYPQTTIATGDLVPFYDINGATGQTTCNITLANFKSQIFASPTLTGTVSIAAANFSGVATLNGGMNIYQAANALTISSDTITINTGMMHLSVDTEGGAASDNLASITPLVNGQVIFVRIANAARTVTIKNTGNILVGSDKVMNSLAAVLQLKGGSSKWVVQSWYDGS